MTVTVLPVDTGTYGADLHDDWIEAVSVQGDAATQGVVRGMLDELEVTGASSPINVATGWAIVKGKLVKNTSNVSVNIPTPASNPRIDRIVVQVDFTTTPVSASIVRVAGTEATVPSVPALDQVDGTIWQVPLAQAIVTTGGVVTIADDRRYLGHGHVDTDSIQDGAVTRAKLSAASGMSVIGRSASSSGQPADIAASADGQVLRRSGGALGFGTVTTNGIADNAVDDTKVGDRVAQFYRRQGGSATHWAGYGTSGTTTYTPGAVRMQGGFYEIVVGESANNGHVDITFPVEFSAAPLVFVTLQYVGVSTGSCARLVVMNTYQYSVPSATQFTLYWYSVAGDSFTGSIAFTWLAIGPE